MGLHVPAAELAGWPAGVQLRQFPELRFTYEEEAAPEGFFVPYVWTLVVTHTTLPWHSAAIALFSPQTGDDSGADLDYLGQQATQPASAASQDASDNV